MTDIDPAAIMAEHHGEPGGECFGAEYDCPYMWPCPTYRLAQALIVMGGQVDLWVVEAGRLATENAALRGEQQ